MRAAWPALMARDRPLSTGPFSCGVYGAVSSRQIWRLLQYSTNSELVYSVPLSVRNARGTPMSATNRCTTPRMANALLSRVLYGRCKWEALSTNMTTYREPPKDSWNGPAVSMWTRSSGAAARDVVLCGVGARMPLAIEHPEHGTSSPTSWIPCCWAVAFNTLEWAWARETWKWLIFNTFLFCFCLGTFHQERILLQPSHHITRNRLRLFSLLSCCNGTFPAHPAPALLILHELLTLDV